MRHKTMLLFVALLAMGLCLQSCSESRPDSPVAGVMDYGFSKEGPYKLKTTGEVEVAWMGGNGKNTPDMEKRAFAIFNAHQETDTQPVNGQFTFRVMSMDLLNVHREITAEVNQYWQVDNQAWFSAVVVYDSKGCGTGNGSGGHSDGCSDDTGGCSGDDSGHDGGCSGDHTDTGGDTGGCSGDHSDTGDDSGGCSGDHTDTGGSPGDMGGSPGGDTGGGCGEDHTDGTDHTDGGCSGDHTDTGGSPGDMGGSPGGDTGGGCGEDHTDGTDHTDGGCSGDDTGHTDGGCSGGSSGGSSTDHGNPTSGKNCRVGQIVYVKAYDYATPAFDGDVLGWKWFSSDPDAKRPKDGHQTEWKLCPKTILGGNLVVHN